MDGLHPDNRYHGDYLVSTFRDYLQTADTESYTDDEIDLALRLAAEEEPDGPEQYARLRHVEQDIRLLRNLLEPKRKPEVRRYSTDAAGHEHAPAGSSQGGQFVPTGRGGEHSGAVFHGTPHKDLSNISAAPPTRQFDNATSVFGAFFAPDAAGAKKYAGPDGVIHKVNLTLSKPYQMAWREFAVYQDPTKGAEGERLEPSKWEDRIEELKKEAFAKRKELEDAGHDGIIVRTPRGKPYEIASFKDVSLTTESDKHARPGQPRRYAAPKIDAALWSEIQAVMPSERPATVPAIVGTLRDGKVNVVIVDGNRVMLAARHEKSNRGYDEPDHMDFVGAGNTQEDPDLFQAVWGKPNSDDQQEVYLDDRVDPVDWPFNCYHEETERTYMEAGDDYGTAHDRTNPQEKELREKALPDRPAPDAQTAYEYARMMRDAEEVRGMAERYGKDAAGHEHAPAGSPEGGQFVSTAKSLKASHPFPAPMPVEPPGLGNPKMLAESPELREELRKRDEHTHRYWHAWIANFVHRMLAEPPERDVPLPKEGASRANRVHLAKRALDSVDAAAGDLGMIGGERIGNPHAGVAASHPEGERALAAAKAEGDRRYKQAVVRAEEHLAQLPEDLRAKVGRALKKAEFYSKADHAVDEWLLDHQPGDIAQVNVEE